MSILSGIIGGLGSIGGALIGADAANDAARANRYATDQALGFQRQVYNDTLRMSQPYNAAGYAALNSLAGLAGLDLGAGYQQVADLSSGGGGLYGGNDYEGYVNNNQDLLAAYNGLTDQDRSYIQGLGYDPDTMAGFGQYHYERSGQGEGREIGQLPIPGAGQGGGAISAGGGATDPLTQLQNSPGYQFRMQQGQDSLNSQLARMGVTNSGAALKSGMEYNQNFASNEYGNEFNRLAAIAGLGQAANTSTTQAAQNFGAGAANTALAGGQGQANAAYARGSAYGNGLTDLAYGIGRQFGGGAPSGANNAAQGAARGAGSGLANIFMGY